MGFQTFSLMVGADHAVPVEAGGGTALLTIDQTGGTVYYADNPQVSSTNNQGSIAPGGSQTVAGVTWIRGSSTAGVQVQVSAPSFGTIQAMRFNAGALTASSNAIVAVTWPVAFADANYSVQVVFEDTLNRSTDTTVIRHVYSRTATGFTVIVGVGTNTYTSGQALLHCVGIHD